MMSNSSGCESWSFVRATYLSKESAGPICFSQETRRVSPHFKQPMSSVWFNGSKALSKKPFHDEWSGRVRVAAIMARINAPSTFKGGDGPFNKDVGSKSLR